MQSFLFVAFEKSGLTSNMFDTLGLLYSQGYRLMADYDASDEYHNLFLVKSTLFTLSDTDMQEAVDIMSGVSDIPFESDGEYTLPSGTKYHIEWY